MSLFVPDDFKRFALEHAPSRFVHVTPSDFNVFIKHLFSTDGYTISEGDSDSSQQEYFVCERDGYSLVVLPLLSVPGHEPDPQAIDKVTRLRDHWQAEFASIITPGQFTTHSRKLAKKEGIEIWEWDQLYMAIRTLFFEGQELSEISPQETLEDTTESNLDPELGLKVKWEPREGVDTTWFNLQLTITNYSNRHRYIHLDLPVIVDPKGFQIPSSEFWEGHFKAGLVYSGASVSTNALFSVEQTGDKPPGGRVMLTCHEKIAYPVTYHLSARLKGDACYVVTYCFGRDSEQYKDLTRFRDITLQRSMIGVWFIDFYYHVSPGLVYFLQDNPGIGRIIRPLLNTCLKLFHFIIPNGD